MLDSVDEDEEYKAVQQDYVLVDTDRPPRAEKVSKGKEKLQFNTPTLSIPFQCQIRPRVGWFRHKLVLRKHRFSTRPSPLAKYLPPAPFRTLHRRMQVLDIAPVPEMPRMHLLGR